MNLQIRNTLGVGPTAMAAAQIAREINRKGVCFAYVAKDREKDGLCLMVRKKIVALLPAEIQAADSLDGDLPELWILRRGRGRGRRYEVAMLPDGQAIADVTSALASISAQKVCGIVEWAGFQYANPAGRRHSELRKKRRRK